MTTTTDRSNVLHRKGGTIRVSGSVRVWFVLVAYLAAAKIILTTLFSGSFADPSQAAVFSWPSLSIFSVLGLGGVLLSQRTGFPDAWSAKITPVRRILLPVVLGAAWAAIPIVIDRLTGYTQLVAARHGLELQYNGFWQTLFSFSAGSILVEVLYRLLIIPLVLFLVSNLIFNMKHQDVIFWIMAALTSLLEPLSQIADLSVVSGLPFFVLFAQSYLFNFTQAAFFRRYGFLSAILLRVGFYFIWHTLYIH